MRDVRRHARIAYRLAVDLFCSEDPGGRQCHTRDIGLGGMFAIGGECLRRDEAVWLELGPPGRGRLHLGARVSRVTPSGAALELIDNSPATLEVLEALLQPKWDGGSLLDGVVTIAPWFRQNDLAGWMRLTSIVSDWQRLTRR
jgi:hypothetical protein